MKRLFYAITTTLALAGLTSLATAQSIWEKDAGAIAQVPIRDLQSTQGITISGQVTSVVGNDFILDDGTAQVIVDAGPRWWQEVNLNVGEWVTVTGEMDEGEFDAFSITRADGTVIDIRPAEGPPPWAGRENRRR